MPKTNEKRNEPFYSHELAAIVKRFFSQWKNPVMVIYGNPDTGKTDTALLFMEIAKNEGVLDHFATNIQNEMGEQITSLEDVDYWFKHQTGMKCYILDEAGMHCDSRSALKKLNREIRHEVFLIRKFKGHMVFVLQDISDLDTWKDSPLTGMKVKKKKYGTFFQAVIKTKWERDLIIADDFPRTTIEFNTYDIAPFTLEKTIEMDDVKLKGLPYKVAFLYAKIGNMSAIARELTKEEGKKYHFQQVKRLLMKYLREQLRIKVKRGRPRKYPKKKGKS